MSKFILIEPSLRKVGGHFYEYAREILGAAEQSGYEPYLAVNRRFRQTDLFPAHWRVTPIFPHTSDRIHRVRRSARRQTRGIKRKWFQLLDGLTDRFKTAISEYRWLRQWTRIRGIDRACDRLFREIRLNDGDQVFCSTVSDLDLLGFTRFLARWPNSKQADWHFQFHFRILDGRDPEYASQEQNIASLRRRLSRAVAQVPRHRLHFYTTTPHLAEQYDRLGIGPFRALPWPVSKQFENDARTCIEERPLRLVCGGAVRREKGADHFSALAESLRTNLLEAGRVQLLFQADDKRRTQWMLGLPAQCVASATSVNAVSESPAEFPRAPIVKIPHPLSPSEYAAYIKGADIGLLLYDADEYYVRCSGILVEFLTAGVPVIAPAGCWLGDQLAAANNEYLDALAARVPAVKTWAARELSWAGVGPVESDATSSPPIVAVGRGFTSTEIHLPASANANDLLIRFNWFGPPAPGCYLHITVDQFDCHGATVRETNQVIGRRIDDGGNSTAESPLPVALFHLHPYANSIRIELRNAFHDSSITLSHIRFDLLAAPPVAAGSSRHWPAGRIGLAAANVAQIPQLVADIVENFGHYSGETAKFAKFWNQQHASFQTIRCLKQQARQDRIETQRRAG